MGAVGCCLHCVAYVCGCLSLRVCAPGHPCSYVCARVSVSGAAVGCLHLSAVIFICILFRHSSVLPSPVDHLLGSKSLVKIVGVCPIINICNMAFTQTAKTILIPFVVSIFLLQGFNYFRHYCFPYLVLFSKIFLITYLGLLRILGAMVFNHSKNYILTGNSRMNCIGLFSIKIFMANR